MFKEGVKYGSVLLNIGMILIVRNVDSWNVTLKSFLAVFLFNILGF